MKTDFEKILDAFTDAGCTSVVRHCSESTVEEVSGVRYNSVIRIHDIRTGHSCRLLFDGKGNFLDKVVY